MDSNGWARGRRNRAFISAMCGRKCIFRLGCARRRSRADDKMYEITSAFHQVSGLDDVFVGAKIRKEEKACNFVSNAVEGSVSGERTLKAKCPSQVEDAVEYSMELFVSVLGIWLYLIAQT